MDALNFSKNIPPWLNQAAFEKAIRSYENDSQATVISFDLKSATKPGDNYASAVFRGLIKFTSKYSKNEREISVIIKTLPVGVDLPGMEHLQNSSLFETEVNMYNNVLPAIQSLLQSVGESDLVCPKLIYQTMTPKPIIILEDVSANGYDKLITTLHDDFEVSKRIIRRLAKFHAAGYFLSSEQKIDPTVFSSSLYGNKDIAEAMFNDNLDTLIETMESWEGFEKYIEPMKAFRKNYMERGLKSYSPGAFNVLNHGDFHFKNILYKMKGDGEEIDDFILLDYQISIYASPAIDLSYAIYNFLSDENRLNRLDEFIIAYHTQFVDSLKSFGYLKSPPSLLDLQMELLKNGNVRVFIAMCLYPFLLLDYSKLTMEDFAEGPKAFKMKVFNGEQYKKAMSEDLKTFLYKGFLK